MSQLPVKLLILLLDTSHCTAYSSGYSYTHQPFAVPGAHVHRYSVSGTETFDDESEQAAPFEQGLLSHSFTSTSQAPSAVTAHKETYSSIGS